MNTQGKPTLEDYQAGHDTAAPPEPSKKLDERKEAAPRRSLRKRISGALGRATGAGVVVVAIFGAEALWGAEPLPLLIGVYIASALFERRD